MTRRAWRLAQAQDQARKRIGVILLVLSGQLTATAGAEQLGISRKSYYGWENRAMKGLAAALQQRPPGRPRTPPPEPTLAALPAQVAQLQAENQQLRRQAMARDLRTELDQRLAQAAAKKAREVS